MFTTVAQQILKQPPQILHNCTKNLQTPPNTSSEKRPKFSPKLKNDSI